MEPRYCRSSVRHEPTELSGGRRLGRAGRTPALEGKIRPDPDPSQPMLFFPPLLGLFLAAAAPQKEADPLPPDAKPEITRAELEHHVRFLASDELGGRALFSAGTKRASEYLARALAAAGLEPAGDDGTFFEEIDSRSLEITAQPRLRWTSDTGEVAEAALGVDFDVELRGRARSTEMLPVTLFFDYTADRLPSKGDPTHAIYFGVGPAARAEYFERRSVTNLHDWGLELDVDVGPDGYDQGKPKTVPATRIASVGAADGCERVVLRGDLRRQLERGKLKSIQLLVEESESPAVERNVVGRLRGAGTAAAPELAQETVLLIAHYDHLGSGGRKKGRREESGGDQIYNGADDNASGCATLLELAQAYASGAKPVRTLVFLFTSGEEVGGLGIKDYMGAPAEPLERTVASLCFEMLGRPDEKLGGPGKLWLTGHERSNLGATFAARSLAIAADPRPEQKFFQRSDNYQLALAGIVSQTLSSFGTHADYHKPSDEPDTLDYGHLEAAAKVARAAVDVLVDGSVKPEWLEGMRPHSMRQAGNLSPEEQRRQAMRDARDKAGPKQEKEPRDEGQGEEDGDGGDR